MQLGGLLERAHGFLEVAACHIGLAEVCKCLAATFVLFEAQSGPVRLDRVC